MSRVHELCNHNVLIIQLAVSTIFVALFTTVIIRIVCLHKLHLNDFAAYESDDIMIAIAV